MATDYDWHPRSNRGGSVFKVETRNLGWWVVLAVIVSIFIHILLYFLMIKWERRVDTEEFLNFRVNKDQIKIEQLEEILKNEDLPDKLDIVEPGKITDADPTNLDDFDMMDILKNEPIRMAPVDAPQVFAASMPQVPPQAIDMAAKSLDLASADVLSQDLQDMRQKLVDASTPVTAEQPVLVVDNTDELAKGLNTDEFFKKAASKVMGTKADEFVKGYASLDSLIGRGGGIQPGEKITAVLPTDILFTYGEATLLDDAKIALMKLAYLIETNPNALFVIEGHTDSFGGDEYNRLLSQRRADAVKEWLVKRLRIGDTNIRTIGKGKSEPIVSIAGDQEQQSLNRRVEIEILR